MAGKFINGAFIQYSKAFLVPIPNVIVFQFNPETITHNWSIAATQETSGWETNPLAVKGSPGETFQFTLVMDSNEMIAGGSALAQGIATASGVYTRLAALEMLLYPEATGAGQLLGAAATSLDNSSPTVTLTDDLEDDHIVPLLQLPTVLWVWGPGRVLPVKVTSLNITEKLYDSALLNPTHAEAQIGLEVMTPEDLGFVQGPVGPLAKIAYKYTQGLRATLALANLANSAESVIGLF